MSEAARSRRDDPRYEPQLAVPGRDVVQASSDPLAELARLVGQDDPFRNVFRPAPTHGGTGRAARFPGDGGDPAGAADAQGFDEHGPYGDAGHAHPDHAYHPADVHAAEHGHDGRGYEGQGYDEQGYDEGHHGEWHGHHAGADEAYDERYYAAEQGRHIDEAGLAEEQFAADAAAAALPDVWAQGVTASEDGAAHPQIGADRRSSARRPLAVLAAVLVLTGGGLAASFLAKGPAAPGAATATANHGAPTIMAATGPTKVKVEDPGATAPEDQDAALLNKNANVSSSSVKIVSSQEQPVDLGQLPKTTDLADGARPLPPAAPSPFPEPKRVKTFVVHPDGTMLSADGAPADGTGSLAPAGAAMPATPKTASRGGTTPQTTAAVASPGAPPQDAIAALSAPSDEAAAAKPARQPAAPGARVASTKPNDAADAPHAAGGTYGVQLASSPVEADANAAFAKLKKRFPSQLGSLTASVHKAETGDKPVYRVRVGSLSQDEANALCSQLRGAGGSCFVVRN